MISIRQALFRKLRLSGTRRIINGRRCGSDGTTASRQILVSPIISGQSYHCHQRINNILSRKLSSSTSTIPHFSQRQVAELEDNIGRSVGASIRDPVLGKPLEELKFLQKRIAISNETGCVHLLLKLPTLLHPALEELKELVRASAQVQVDEWLAQQRSTDTTTNDNSYALTVNVEAVATKPMPIMAQLADDSDDLEKSLGPGLANVTHFLAVYSCKGGVGKSTVAVNLAYELAQRGGRVGILDVDIYGPSLPLLISPQDITVRRSPKGPGMVYPIEHRGVKALSLGYVAVKSGVPGSGDNNGAAVMRGPLAGRVVSQLLKGTDWDELDVLILDLPPGTGDVQLAVCQDVQLSGAVAVTTPSRLAIEDTKKGIEMFTAMGVPTLSVVENMSYFVCENGTVHYPFGKGLGNYSSTALGKLPRVNEFDVIKLPISAAYNYSNGDDEGGTEALLGDPIVLTRQPNTDEQLDAFRRLAEVVSGELLKIQYGQTEQDQTMVSLDGHQFAAGDLRLEKTPGTEDSVTVRLFSPAGAVQRVVSGKLLRATDPKSGQILEGSTFANDLENSDLTKSRADSMLNKSSSSSTETVSNTGKRSPAILPTSIEKKGRYGFAVEFADGGTIIYSMLSLAIAAGAELGGDN